MDFFEFGIYVAIIAVAGAVVLTLCVIMLKNMWPKKARMAGAVQARQITGSDVKRISAKSAGGKDDDNAALKGKKDNKKDKGKNKVKNKGKNKEEGLLLIERDNSRSSPAYASADKKAGGEKANNDDRNIRMEADQQQASNASQADATTSNSAAEQMPVVEEEIVQDLSIGELPTLDTLTDEVEEPEHADLSAEMLSFFETGDAEDSGVTDLANNLFDVDVGNIGQLGEEIKQFLSGKR